MTPPWWACALRSKALLIVLGALSLLYGQGEAFQAPVPPFEGVISYKVKIKGKQAAFLQENEPHTRMDLYIQGNRFIVNEHGGATPVTRIYDPDRDRLFVLDPRFKIAYMHEKYRKKPQNYPATYTGQTDTLLGIPVYAFHVKKPNEEILYYVSPKYRVNLSLFQGKKRAYAFFLNDGLYGAIPLKMIRKQEGLTIEVTAVSIRPMKLDVESMKIPKGYKIRGYDPRPR